MEVRYQHFRIPMGYVEDGQIDINNLSGRAKPQSKYLYYYSRRYGFTFSETHKPFTRGGMTICTIHDGESTYEGWATCSLHDNFCYRLGREIAYGRAKAQMEKLTGGE